MASPPPPRSPPNSTDKAWYQYLTLDLLLQVLNRTFLHPFVAWIIPLSLRAQATPYSHPAFISTTAYAIFLTLLTAASYINRRIAHGLPRDVELGEEVVVVAGGASGLGLLIAEFYGMRGVSVAVLDIRKEEEVGEGFQELPAVEYYQCDVGNRSEVEAVAGRITKDLGTPTIVINCVATTINGSPLLSLPASAITKTIQANLLSHFHILQTFLPGILSEENGGTIVTVSSVIGHLSAAGLADYAASKAALSSVHRTLEAELRASGDNARVKALLVETGQMATPLFDGTETPNSFFAPILEPVKVAQEIVSAIDCGNGGVIRLPAFATWVNWYAVLPASVQRFARYISGIDTAMAKRRSAGKADERSRSSNGQSESDLELVEMED
ncbi:putative secondary metabolism biosynthetic enzyme [Arachnomyces sp. PD_36]|nr:putative secondary metabolism biosynthetic enzyme [Arachnomyces sp. PD_36]